MSPFKRNCFTRALIETLLLRTTMFWSFVVIPYGVPITILYLIHALLCVGTGGILFSNVATQSKIKSLFTTMKLKLHYFCLYLIYM